MQIAPLAYARLYAQNLLHNLHTIQQKIPQKCGVIAMIKANAYGHGLTEVGHILQHKVAAFGVARWEEVRTLRQHDVQTPLVLMSGLQSSDETALLKLWQNACVVHTPQQAQWLAQWLHEDGHHGCRWITPVEGPWTKPLPKVWIKIDTGMGRLGMSPEQGRHMHRTLVEALHHQGFSHQKARQSIGYMSHFAMAQDPGHRLTQGQIAACQRLCRDEGPLVPYSFCNSDAVDTCQSLHQDFVRIGLALYGAGESHPHMHLRPVMHFMSKILQIKTLEKGHAVGYDGTYVCPHPSRIAIIGAGYGDGYPVTVQGGYVTVCGYRAPVIGRVSMDMLAIDLSAYPTTYQEPYVGKEVCLWGQEPHASLVAQWCGQNAYSVLTGLTHRPQRQWIP